MGSLVQDMFFLDKIKNWKQEEMLCGNISSYFLIYGAAID